MVEEQAVGEKVDMSQDDEIILPLNEKDGEFKYEPPLSWPIKNRVAVKAKIK